MHWRRLVLNIGGHLGTGIHCPKYWGHLVIHLLGPTEA